jgi:hypothetical protein
VALDKEHVSNLWCANGAVIYSLAHVVLLLNFCFAIVVSSYMSDSPHMSFLSYFMSTTPNSSHRHLRLKTILCLAGSMLYDPAVIYPQLLALQNNLKLELAIIEGMVCVIIILCLLHSSCP